MALNYLVVCHPNCSLLPARRLYAYISLWQCDCSRKWVVHCEKVVSLWTAPNSAVNAVGAAHWRQLITLCCTSRTVVTVVVAFWRLESKHFGLDKAGTPTTYLPITYQTLRWNETVDGGHRLYNGGFFIQSVVPFHARRVKLFRYVRAPPSQPLPRYSRNSKFVDSILPTLCTEFHPNLPRNMGSESKNMESTSRNMESTSSNPCTVRLQV